jgi:hypothetical protein|tara:strand:- start:285 stop:482 length:198 start_codon:yes stop_codon:yes gene_type:complete
MNKKKETLLLPCYEHDIREYIKRCNAHVPTAKELGILISLEDQEKEEKELEAETKLILWKQQYNK